MKPFTRRLKNLTYNIFGTKGYDFLRLLYRILKIQFKVPDFNDETITFHKKIIKEESIILDIGSNRGFFTYHYSKAVKKGFVYSFEPIPSTYILQKQLLKFFRIKNYKAFQIALSDKTGNIEMLLPKNGCFPEDLCATIKTDSAERNFQHYEIINSVCETLNNVVLKEQIKRIDFIKMDVEGAEFLVLKGGNNALNLRPIIFMEMIDRHFKKFGYEKEDIINFLKSMDFKPMFLDEEKSILKSFGNNGEGYQSLDIYFVPKEKIPLLVKKNLYKE